MSDPQNPNDPFNQPSANQPWGQQSANQPDPQPWGQQSAKPPEAQQPWGQQPADPYAAQPWGDQPQQPADQWGGQYGQQADPSTGQWGQPQADPNAGQWGQQQADPNAGQWGQQQADPNAGQWGQQSWGAAPGKQPSMLASDSKGLFKALFDFSFTSFVTPKIIKVVYMVVTIAIGLGILGFIITALSTGSFVTILAALIFGPLAGLIYLALARMTMELYYAVIRLSEDVHERLPRP